MMLKHCNKKYINKKTSNINEGHETLFGICSLQQNYMYHLISFPLASRGQAALTQGAGRRACTASPPSMQTK